MSKSELQNQIFQLIKMRLPSHLSLVDEVAATLSISSDSAYRRLRGEKLMTLEEVHKLCLKYQVSLDQLMHLQSEGFVFSGSFINPDSFRFEQWLQSVMRQVEYMNGFREKKLFYLLKDIPVFHHFHFRELAAFKHYVWMKGIFHDPSLTNRKFSLDDYPDHLFTMGQEALDLYNKIDSVEIWNLETINSTMRQIDYYYESNLFEKKSEVLAIYEALEKLMVHLSLQAEEGFKFRAGGSKAGESGRFEMFLNEMVIGDNSVLVTLDGKKMAFLIHSVINLLATRDERFCENLFEAIQNLMKKSTLISSFSERERSRYFKHLRSRIVHRKETLGI